MKFFLTGVGTLFTSIILLVIILAGFSVFSTESSQSALFGVILSLLFVCGGFFSFLFALKFRQKAFNKFVGISILGRLLLMTIILLMILQFLKIDRAAFLIAMFISYFLFQIWEVISFNRIAIKKA